MSLKSGIRGRGGQRYQLGGGSAIHVIASYATGSVDGGAGDGDLSGGLVGLVVTGAGSISLAASYSFGTATGEDNTRGTDGSAKPSGVNSAADLAGDSGNATTYAGDEWDAAVWNFGDSTQAPALLYVDGYDSSVDPAYSCDAASFPVSLMVSCGATLLPGPAGSPQDR